MSYYDNLYRQIIYRKEFVGSTLYSSELNEIVSHAVLKLRLVLFSCLPSLFLFLSCRDSAANFAIRAAVKHL
jgi:hypothetical protein